MYLSKPMVVSKKVLDTLRKIRENANQDGITTFSHADMIAVEQQVKNEDGSSWLSKLNNKNHDLNNEKLVRVIMFINGDDDVFKEYFDFNEMISNTLKEGTR